ncbi:hypothetical protein LINGRAHAP2_LOCUS10153 [Linum grandiflorum]
MAETTCRLLLLSLPLLLLIVFNIAPSVAGDGFLDQINSESVSELLSSSSLDDAKKAMSPDVQGAVQQLAASANAKSDEAKEALNSLSPAEGPDAFAEGPGSPGTSPESSEQDLSSWKNWIKEKMQGIGYGGSQTESPEAAPGPAFGPTSSDELSSIEEAPAAAPTAEGPTAEGPTAETPTAESPMAEAPTTAT